MRFQAKGQAPRGESEKASPRPPHAPSQAATPPTTFDGPAHTTPTWHMRSDHEASARGSNSPRSTAPLAGSTELPRELMLEAEAGNQTGLRGPSARLPRLLSTLRRPGLP